MDVTKEVAETHDRKSSSSSSATAERADVEAQGATASKDDTGSLDKEKTDEQADNDPNVVDWDGSDDPENPLNWPSWRKVTTLGVVSFIPFLSCVYAPADGFN